MLQVVLNVLRDGMTNFSLSPGALLAVDYRTARIILAGLALFGNHFQVLDI